jgi:hypothetical protein
MGYYRDKAMTMHRTLPSLCHRLLVLSLGFIPASGFGQTTLLWGDTHLHTSHSTDAYASGNLIADPDVAYRYARGLPVIHPSLGTRVQLGRPLDFLVVADHSDYLGLQVYLQKDDPRLTDNPRGKRLQEMVREDPGSIFRLIFGTNPEFSSSQLQETYLPIREEPWLDEIAAAERFNEPGVFTAFAGWEWSAQPNSRNLHRVVFSPAGADELRQFFPISNLDTQRPEDFWQWLEQTSQATGADFIAIPHNPNMSAGLMFDRVDSDGRPLTAEYARTRARWEPVAEMSQVKGTSEVHPELSPNDEFAEFEIYRRLFMARAPEANGGDYMRSALLRGLEIEQQVGENPFKLGMIGSSDIHTGLSTLEEDNFLGAVARDTLPVSREAAPRKRPPNQGASPLSAWELSASGLAGVWATENTREAIAAAFSRKEVYATSGPRIQLRVFGGFSFYQEDAAGSDIAAIGYAKGIPMGGDLTAAPDDSAPTLLIHAVKDPEGANLDRVQVIKGWVDSSGDAHEQIYDVAWSGDRSQGPDGKVPAVGNTVNLETASYGNDIGAPQLAAVWQDPAFDPAVLAFYYVRVIEIPTPRHQVYDAVALGLDPAETAQPSSIQERAWSSPIWYTP